MKKEEQIKQLRVQLLAYNDTVCFTESKLDGLKANRQVVIDQLNELEKNSEKTVIGFSDIGFSDIVITGYLDSLGEIRELDQSTTIEELSKEYHSVQFLGYNTSAEKVAVCCTRGSITRHGMPMIRLFFGEEVEKPLKHPHMKNIVATFCISAVDEFEVEKLTDADKINWEDCDEVQLIGEDQEYGIVVKATLLKEVPNQFSLFFCEKK